MVPNIMNRAFFKYQVTLEVTTVNITEQFSLFNTTLKKVFENLDRDDVRVRSYFISPIKQSKRYVVNKSAMAFKKRGKEAYNEQRTKAWFEVMVYLYIPFGDMIDACEPIDDLLNTALKTAGFFDCNICASRSNM